MLLNACIDYRCPSADGLGICGNETSFLRQQKGVFGVLQGC
jgi:hypothetical protein